MTRGRLIAFEGGEACGKSTQAARLAARLDAVLTREPGGTPVGERVRDVLLDPSVEWLDDRAEALLMAAARAQHIAQVIGPTLEAGHHVVTDRFTHSSLAYQGYGRGLDIAEVARLSAWATRDRWPDLVVLLDVDPRVAVERRTDGPDRLEAAGDDFHERVRAGFLDLAAREPDRWVVIDGTQPVDLVAAAVADAVTVRLGLSLDPE